MAIKTMAKNASGGSMYEAGWHQLTISKATDGIWVAKNGDEKRTIDLEFDGYPDYMGIRIFESFNKQTGEEFKIANLFRYACAGIIGVLNDPTGKNPVIQYDDEVKNLVGKQINTFFYKETNKTTGKEYSKISDSIAPVAQETEHITWNEDQVTIIKEGAEKFISKQNSNKETTSPNVADTVDTTTADSIPF